MVPQSFVEWTHKQCFFHEVVVVFSTRETVEELTVVVDCFGSESATTGWQQKVATRRPPVCGF